jgi:hypothetical protein
MTYFKLCPGFFQEGVSKITKIYLEIVTVKS